MDSSMQTKVNLIQSAINALIISEIGSLDKIGYYRDWRRHVTGQTAKGFLGLTDAYEVSSTQVLDTSYRLKNYQPFLDYASVLMASNAPIWYKRHIAVLLRNWATYNAILTKYLLYRALPFKDKLKVLNLTHFSFKWVKDVIDNRTNFKSVNLLLGYLPDDLKINAGKGLYLAGYITKDKIDSYNKGASLKVNF
jgi:hypothetical protein